MTNRDWGTYGRWAGYVTLLFAPMYPLCNWISAQRTDTLALYLPWELQLPFIPEMIWVYFSMYILFVLPPFFLDTSQMVALGRRLFWGTAIAGITYLLLPSKLGFPRQLPEDPLHAQVFAQLFTVDQPHNMVPSLHIVFTTLLTLSFASASRASGGKAFWWGWMLLISASTVLVRQHHLLDVLAGLIAAALLVRWIPEKPAANN